MKIIELLENSSNQFSVDDVISTLTHGHGRIERIDFNNNDRIIIMRQNKTNKLYKISPNDIIDNQPYNGIGFDKYDQNPTGQSAGAIPAEMNI